MTSPDLSDGRALPGGLVLRTARPADLDQIGALLVERGEEGDDVDHRLVVQDPDAGWESCAVVVDGDRVVSTATLLDETVHVDGVVLPAGQVELVATATDHEGRGHVRALMAWAHERSRARGHVLQVMIGIPYFYRLFGYEYAIDIPRARDLAERPRSDGGAGDALRPATRADLPHLARLQDAAQAPYDVAMAHPEPRPRWLLDHDGSTTWVLDRAGSPVATARVRVDDDAALVAEAAAEDDDAADVLLAGLIARHPDMSLRIVHRPLTVPGHRWEPRLGPAREDADQYYARVPDAGVLLEALRPVLSARLVGSGLDRTGRDVVVSTFGAHHRLAVTPEGLGPVRTGGPLQGPGTEGGCGVAPDALGALLLGPYGIAGLTRRRPDVYPGPDAELMAALFPPRAADLLTYYLPW